MATVGSIEDYWNECEQLPFVPNEEEIGSRSCEEGEIEAEWMEEIGCTEFAAAFKESREVSLAEVDKAVQHFSTSQAEAVRRRVRTLNNTVRKRNPRGRNRKADVREVFKQVEVQKQNKDIPDSRLFTTTINISDDSMQQRRRLLARTPSIPIPHPDMFRNYVPDVPGSDGLPLVSYHYVGTLPRHRSGSDPLILDEGLAAGGSDLLSNTRLSRSHGSLLDVPQYFGVESIDEQDKTFIDSLNPSDIQQLKPFVVAEATTIMDDYCTYAYKRKAFRSSRKPEGEVFGAALSTLLEKDDRFFKGNLKDHSYVPAIFQTLVGHLERNHLKEEGLLRVAGLKTRIDVLISKIEAQFYQDRLGIQQMLLTVSPHDVTSVLKKLLRELPEPLLTHKLIYKFYSSHGIVSQEIQKYVLNLMVLQLPREHQATFLFLMRFLHKILDMKEFNKMGLHSIATILAPSLFPPRCILQSKEDMDSQVRLAENCIDLTEQIILAGESLWIVPRKLMRQLRARNQKENNRPSIFRNGKSREVTGAREVHRPGSTMVVEASQFDMPQLMIPVTESLTAGDVVINVMREGLSKYEGTTTDSQKAVVARGRMKPLSELAPGIALSCVLSGAEPETALQTHFLHEYGGNIVERELDHSSIIVSVLRENPGARWKLECRHRNCPKR